MRLGLFHLATTLAMTACVATAGSFPPAGARQVISLVRSAALEGDLSALRSLMADDFTWSFGFGADNSPDQAIAAWRSSQEALAALGRMTADGCDPISEGVIQCPRNAGMSYRAGFAETRAGWRMVYFVAGD